MLRVAPLTGVPLAAGDRLASSLWLQELLYYQKFFTWCWFIANMVLITYKRARPPSSP